LKNLTVLLWSYLFYAWGAPALVPLLFAGSLADYAVSKKIAAGNRQQQKWWLGAGVAMNLALLGYYKYANFFVGEFNRAAEHIGLSPAHWTDVALPIGISFFTFQKLSYLIDVYRNETPPADNVVNYLLYVVSFPQLIAGPIVRYRDISRQIESRDHNPRKLFDGANRFCFGLAKKVLIADPMGAVANHVFQLSGAELSTPYAWLGIVAYAYQIYFDFSAYSDMAIGLGKLMGFTFLENFNRPYTAKSFTDFWRRWHISLSRWMKDYLYIPLGGNRVPPWRMYLNLWIVFILSGFWHGASWTFVAWGCYHGFFLAADKLFWLNTSKRLGSAVNTVLTFLLVCVGWVLFRSDTFSQAFEYLVRMFDPISYWAAKEFVPRGLVIHNYGLWVFTVATVLSFVPNVYWDRITTRLQATSGLSARLVDALRFSAGVACLILSALAVSTTNFSPFIYFRF
jgi:alginate O-acetyltransferase complex protein AlgI